MDKETVALDWNDLSVDSLNVIENTNDTDIHNLKASKYLKKETVAFDWNNLTVDSLNSIYQWLVKSVLPRSSPLDKDLLQTTIRPSLKVIENANDIEIHNLKASKHLE